MSRHHLNPLLLTLCLGWSALLPGCASTPTPHELPPSKMVETTDLAEVTDNALELARQVGTDRVLVVFDLDNTLLAMEQGLGSDQWYDWQKETALRTLATPGWWTIAWQCRAHCTSPAPCA
jgi:hypothetical protein